MEKVTNEKSLAVMDYNIFAKMRRFFINFFNKKQNVYKESEIAEQDTEIKEEPVKKTRKLFDYDAEVDDNMPENIPDDIQEKDKVEENVENAINYVSEEATESQASEEKEELERKLMNYYASIKNGI